MLTMLDHHHKGWLDEHVHMLETPIVKSKLTLAIALVVASEGKEASVALTHSTKAVRDRISFTQRPATPSLSTWVAR